ncbi:MAG: UDP-N-acetylmuramoyl-L-alanyl-D-glutamate--2,6-diaminopimelate ligase, partial [Leptospiraceae bacterium]|nr:UDP-N-acetylmuramoyl-L-alanyl-D-glutamate--2,6-diaminopimelate ligase [Leptospiraceae bacterium]
MGNSQFPDVLLTADVLLARAEITPVRFDQARETGSEELAVLRSTDQGPTAAQSRSQSESASSLSEIKSSTGILTEAADADVRHALRNHSISALNDDSRRSDAQTIFILNAQGEPYFEQAIRNTGTHIFLGTGAHVTRFLELCRETKAASLERLLFISSDLPRHQGRLAAALYNFPSKEMHMVGVTGTNGKTSISHMLYAVWKEQGRAAGVIGTLGVKWMPSRSGEEQSYKTGYTTPRAPELQRILARMRADGIERVVLEASSEALDLGRLYGCQFDTAIFTNLTVDHLDHHGSMEAYYQSKKILFQMCMADAGRCVIYTGDAYGRRLLEELKAEFPAVPANRLVGIERPYADLQLPMPALFHRVNATLVLNAEQWDHQQERQARQTLRTRARIPGRFELVLSEQDRESQANSAPVYGIVDYAHTPDALENALQAVRELQPDLLICVFGCGGNRDASKRPRMGAIGARLADVLIVCDDNPRR